MFIFFRVSGSIFGFQLTALYNTPNRPMTAQRVAKGCLTVLGEEYDCGFVGQVANLQAGCQPASRR
jgi:hypothetical protein